MAVTLEVRSDGNGSGGGDDAVIKAVNFGSVVNMARVERLLRYTRMLILC